MIATGETMATAIAMLRRQGAKRVYLAAVHPVLTGSAVLRLYRSGVEAVLATDTLDKAVSTVSVAPVIARALSEECEHSSEKQKVYIRLVSYYVKCRRNNGSRGRGVGAPFCRQSMTENERPLSLPGLFFSVSPQF